MSKAAATNPTANKYRRYALAAIFGLLVLYFGGEWVWRTVLEGPIEKKRQAYDKLLEAKKKKEKEWEGFKEGARKLAEWRKQSLPSDTEVARSLYQAWLLQLVVEYVKLDSPSVSPGEPLSRQGRFYAIPFSVRGRGTLDQLTKFLFAFYRTDLLHQIRSLNVTPLGNSEQLDLAISIETLVLPGAGPELDKDLGEEERQETIIADFQQRASHVSQRLASLTLAKYTPPTMDDYQPIARRNLFGVGSDPDPTDYAYLTFISSVNGEPEVWFTLRATDETLKLREGDSLRIGNFTGTIAEIEGSDVILESEGERWLLTLGEKLTDAFALPPEF
ncbi:MAG TPA: hypothetical protein VMY37_40450 [Thermoguttaceae bacterium]|nr:hypothetical protein [Thermoguttaceae bacterium]